MYAMEKINIHSRHKINKIKWDFVNKFNFIIKPPDKEHICFGIYLLLLMLEHLHTEYFNYKD